MNVRICKTNWEEMIDFTEEDRAGAHCLLIAAREGQIIRAAFRNQLSIGWWSLKKSGYLNSNGLIVPEKFLEFDRILFGDPERVYKPVRSAYKRLIKAVRNL